MKNAISRFLRDEEGATAIEYGIIAGMMAIVLIFVFGPTGSLTGAIKDSFQKIADTLNGK